MTRALSLAALAEQKRVFLVRGPWISDFLSEAAAFPNATHDDQIDAVSLSLKLLAKPNKKLWMF